MQLKELKPRKALNKAYLKIKPARTGIENFKANLIKLLEATNDTESEEFHKNLVSDFLKRTWYEPSHFINTKGRNDLVIHNGSNAASSVGVIIEAKKPTNKSEMITRDKLNVKAFQELVLYYLRERITHKNLEVRHLVVTNINEWSIFDAATFDKIFAQNKPLVKQFDDFEQGRLSGKQTDFFYREIAAPFIDTITREIDYTYFDLRDYEKPLRNADKQDDNVLIALYKLLSPEHLLKLPFANDSNSLDKRFYSELLHIIGLAESKEGGKKLIGRKAEGQRNSGSILEDAIIQLDSLDKISRLDKPSQFGPSHHQRLFNVALELSITWVNRILFLKLLEAQLISYHKGDKSYAFLNVQRIREYDDLNTLFFQVLARRHDQRNDDVKTLFEKVPYLNSSLFEPTDLEHTTILISNLKDEKTIPALSATVLSDGTGKKRTGEINTLHYLLEFLDAYDFSSEGSEDIQEDNKTLINASVLGLIFEKINGYKDGSFFTPGFITMYMCRETIRRAVVQKFNDVNGWDCKDIESLYDKIDDRAQANAIINSLRICDPAVGSGHFLVSALNEMIALKHDLKILCDRSGARLKEYTFEVVNDELIVTDEDGRLFEYHRNNRESQRVQEALFHEKQTIIENCLFGVDINPNSVKICRLRLWIELLKNAYYRNATELETLPNIDINIKFGNSLVSRFAIDADLGQALKKSKWNIESYRLAVDTYRNAKSKEEKRAMEKLIADIKSDFRSEISLNDKTYVKYRKLSGELFTLTNQTQLFEQSKKEREAWNKQVKKLTDDTQKLEAEIDEIKNNKIYENAFEWRFEFPEVLDADGNFVGFDVVIGNPPYIRQEELKEFKSLFQANFKSYSGTADIYIYFIERGFSILKSKGVFTYIMPNKFMQAGYGEAARKFLSNRELLKIVDFGDIQVFDEATTYPCILIAANSPTQQLFSTVQISSNNCFSNFSSYILENSTWFPQSDLSSDTWIISKSDDNELLQKIKASGMTLEECIGDGSKRGILTGLSEAFVINENDGQHLIQENSKNQLHLVPFLLGREAKPYATGKPKNYLIKFPKGFTKSNVSDNHEEWFANEYPEIYQHFLPFSEKAEKRTDKGDFYWELRACDYYDKFISPKIMYQVFQVKPCFIFDEIGTYCNNSMWILPTDDKVLLGILNSKMGWWLISKYCTAIQNGYQLIWKYFGQIPIASGRAETRNDVESKVNKILDLKKQDSKADISSLESQIDQLIYQLYGLTEDEIAIVEAAVK